MAFTVKKDLFYRSIFYGSFILFLYLTYDTIVEKEWIAAGLITLINLFLGWTWFIARYTIEDGTLFIKIGPIAKKIPIANMSSLRYTKNPFASAAFALDRIEILTKNNETIQISPKERQKFVQYIQQLNPEVTIDA